MANTRVKVPKAVLIKRIQAEIERATKEHDEAVAKYEKEAQEFLAALPAAIEAAIKEIAALKGDDALEFVRDLRHNAYEDNTLLRVKVKATPPARPELTFPGEIDRRYGYRNFRNFKNHIEALEKSKRILEAATEDVISISATDEYAEYL